MSTKESKAALNSVSVSPCRDIKEHLCAWVALLCPLFPSEAVIVLERICLIMLVLSANITLLCFHKVSNAAADCHGTRQPLMARGFCPHCFQWSVHS